VEPHLGVLDFWLGRWSVRTRDGEAAGVDLVERALAGYAVLEHWRNVAGVEGKSLFYYDVAAATWMQLWVMQGFAKRKELVFAEPGRVRFDGQAFLEGGAIPDRTTLAAEKDGTVSQLIEHSLDGGATWETSFDAVYERL
jgi:hypothetical protein